MSRTVEPRRKSRILVVDDDAAVVELLRDELSERYEVIGSTSAKAALAVIKTENIDLVITDVEMPEMRGTELLRSALESRPNQLVLLITAFGSIEDAVKAVSAGACDFIAKPFTTQTLMLAIERALRERMMRREITRLRKELGEDTDGEVIAYGPAMRQVLELARRAASSSANVLITGESGTGKSALAHWIHARSARCHGPFVQVRCASLTEVELAGLFAEARAGTIVLDGLHELPAESQAPLLELLEHHYDSRPCVVATTTSKLDAKTTKPELVYAINVIPIHVPPLRERNEDIPDLIRAFLARGNRPALRLTDDAQRWLRNLPWPGNVRELANVIERAIALCDHDVLAIDDLRGTPLLEAITELLSPVAEHQLSLAEVERGYIRRVLAQHGSNVTRAARVLGIDRRTLYRKLAGTD